MSKKNGFTLVEVLLTLGIIGIVAALTIPGLYTNIQDISYKNQWKNTYSVLSEAYKQINADNQFNIGSLCSTGSDPADTNCFKNQLIKYVKASQSCDEVGGSAACIPGPCVKDLNGSFDYSLGALNVGGAGIILNDGIMFEVTWQGYNNPSNPPNFNNCGQLAQTGWLPDCHYGDIWIDLNAFNGPAQMGRDVYHLFITDKGLLPDGAPGTLNDSWRDGPDGCGCDLKADSTALGYTCPADYLYGK